MRLTHRKKEGILREDLNGKLDLIVEQNTELLKLKPTVEKIERRLENVEHDVGALKVGHQQMSKDIKDIKKTLTVHDRKLDTIEKKLDTKVDREEFERRVGKLETHAVA